MACARPIYFSWCPSAPFPPRHPSARRSGRPELLHCNSTRPVLFAVPPSTTTEAPPSSPKKKCNGNKYSRAAVPPIGQPSGNLARVDPEAPKRAPSDLSRIAATPPPPAPQAPSHIIHLAGLLHYFASQLLIFSLLLLAVAEAFPYGDLAASSLGGAQGAFLSFSFLFPFSSPTPSSASSPTRGALLTRMTAASTLPAAWRAATGGARTSAWPSALPGRQPGCTRASRARSGLRSRRLFLASASFQPSLNCGEIQAAI